MPICHHFRAIAAALVLCATPLSLYAQGEPEVDPEATRLMKQMSEYLVKLKQFSVQGEAAREDVLRSGEKLMFHHQFKLDLRRPNKLHLSRSDADKDQELVYDGENITLFGRNRKVYATASAPPTIDGALDFTADALGIPMSARDLFYEDVYDELMLDVFKGSYIGKEIIDGVVCDHLAFRSEEGDWQIWIAQGDKPLPRKFVISSRWLAGAPLYAVRFSKWDLAVKLPDSRFAFKAPEGARKIRFLSQQLESAIKNK